MSDYENHASVIRRTSDGAVIPLAPDNPDYMAYEAWLAEGNTPDQPPAAPVPARSASGKQLRYALNDLGVRDAWDAAVGRASRSTQDYWLCCAGDQVPETSLKIGRLCKAIGLSVADLFDKALTE